MNMPFQFPDPSVQSRITHPDTGEVWVYEDGVWQIEEPAVTPTPTPAPTPAPTDCIDYAEVAALRTELNALQTDICRAPAGALQISLTVVHLMLPRGSLLVIS